MSNQNNAFDSVLSAIAMEEEYRKLKMDRDAKTAFNYGEKLRALGFSSTAEYEHAKNEYYIKNIGWTILEIGASEFIEKLRNAIQLEQETIFIVEPEQVIAWIGSDDFNKEYCENNQIPFYEVGYSGGTIVSGPEDVAIGLLVKKRKSLTDYFASIIYSEIKKYFPRANYVKNDILIDGYKVFGMGRKRIGDMLLATYQITFLSYPEEINSICTKKLEKHPKGLQEFGTIDKKKFIGDVLQCLQ